ncbi:copper resistance protein CopC [Streptomyces botrytidirepellens]|uniref:Copper resistance protein CopC n=1 Tax=Streptomyces botrytidirepellens TaxID=2486417 RepID=A0A3M8SFF7_9ACTN|nr:copper resistance protein CopC [Streptomyces botrytidirepellens]RNF77682.1 copper resistance protein CopC [Streptomyces botrytidirepellens]
MTSPAPCRPRYSALRSAATLASLVPLVLVLLLCSAAPASAHATLLFTSPAANATVADSPRALVLVFDKPVGLTGTTVRLKPSASAALGTGRLSQGGRSVTIPLRGRVAGGVHTVDWQVTARDGDVMTGSYRFAVGPRTIALTSGQTTAAKDATPTAVLRWLLFAALALLLGELAADRLAARTAEAPEHRPRRWGLAAALVGCAAAGGLTVLLTQGGSLASVTDTRPGVLSLMEIVGFALAATALLLKRRNWAVLPLAGVLAAEALRAHPQAEHAIAGPLLTLVHLTAAALWAGTLFHVLRTGVVWRTEPAAARTLFLPYARLAAWLFGAVAVTGLVSALLLVPLDDIVTTSYGQVLLAKFLLVLVVGVLALAARRRLRSSKTGSPRRPAGAETVTLAVVFALSATLTVLAVPGDGDRALPFAPPADGPIVPTGTRAGEIGISARASAGQLVLDLATPQVGDIARESYSLSRHAQHLCLTRSVLSAPGGSARCGAEPVLRRRRMPRNGRASHGIPPQVVGMHPLDDVMPPVRGAPLRGPSGQFRPDGGSGKSA